MGWELFTWILATGLFGMFWFLYLSIGLEEKHWKPAAQSIRRKQGHRDGTLAKP
jgi:hypothetical protein